MLKSDFHFDEELIRKISQGIAVDRVNEELAHHPELLAQKEVLLKVKENEVKGDIEGELNEILYDLTQAEEFLIGWFQQIPPEKREALRKEFKRAGEIFQSEWFQKSLKVSMENPLERESPLQKVLKLSDSTLQTIYEAGCHLQREGDFQTARAIFRFLVFLNPLVADFWICLGFCFSNLRNFDQAFQSYQFALELEPQQPNGLYFSAVNFTLQEEYDKAHEYCDKGLTLINGHDTLPQWKPTLLELKQFIDQKKGGSHG